MPAAPARGRRPHLAPQERQHGRGDDVRGRGPGGRSGRGGALALAWRPGARRGLAAGGIAAAVGGLASRAEP